MAGEIDVPAGQLDMQGVVAPFGRIPGAMQHVPIVGRILGTRAVGIPLSVTGDLRDPRVVPLGPAAIGQSLVNLLGGGDEDAGRPARSVRRAATARAVTRDRIGPVNPRGRSARAPPGSRPDPRDAPGGRFPCRP